MRIHHFSYLATATLHAGAWAVLLCSVTGCERTVRDVPPQGSEAPPPRAMMETTADPPARMPTAQPGKPKPSDRAPSEPAPPAAKPGPERGLVHEPDDKATYIYDPSELRTYDLTLRAEDLAFLDEDPRAEQYVEGTLDFEGESYGSVGIRYKGSAGAFEYSGCLSPEGRKACTKMSVKVSFDYRDPDGRFYGLRKLQFHAMFHDASMMKERLAYHVFREFGVPAPRAVHARLRVNGQLLGLFTLVEQIDGRFTRSRFSEGGEGNLYKETWPLRANRGAVSRDALREGLETNKDENPAFDGMLAFSAELVHADLYWLPAVLERYTDVDHTLRYLAVDRTLAVDDGLFHWYCGGERCWNHNYYWYESSKHDTLWLIPWDMDGSFNLDNSITTIWMPWDDTDMACEAQVDPPFEVPLRAPACDKLTLGWATLQDRWLAQVDELMQGPFAADAVEDQLREWEAQIEPAVAEAARLHSDAVPASTWRQSVDDLRDTIDTLRERARERLDQGPRRIRDPWPEPDTAANATATP